MIQIYSRALYNLILAVFLGWGLFTNHTHAANDTNEYLLYRASYHGLLTVGLNIDIADIALGLPSPSSTKPDVAKAIVTLDTQDFTKIELFMPIRFCYRNSFRTGTLATIQASWWNRIGNRITKAQLKFNSPERLVQFRQVERRLAGWSPSELFIKKSLKDQPWASMPDPEQFKMAFPDTENSIMDRLTMVHWLRKQELAPGMNAHLLVSDGRKLIGFDIEVEGTDELVWEDKPLSSLRIRLQPRFNKVADDSPIWVWLSQDVRRLPLLFRSKQALGTFEVQLVRITNLAPACNVPEAVSLELPAFK